jgi:hypothetical protein
VAHSSTRAESMRRHWAAQADEERQSRARTARQGLVVAEIKRQIAESRHAQGLPEHIAAERFLDDLAREVLGGGPGA